jgi:SNF2 family DNA or RNA helicase
VTSAFSYFQKAGQPLTMPFSETHHKRRILILDSSSESERSLSDSVISIGSSSNDGGAGEDKATEIVDLVETMNQIAIESGSEDRNLKRPALYRGGIESLNFDSDSDSSLELFEPTFKSKPKPIVLDDSSDLSACSQANNTVVCSRKIPIYDDRRNKKASAVQGANSAGTECTSGEFWALDRNRNEYFFKSSASSRMPKFRIPEKLYGQLFEHQQDGVSWMAGLHCQGVGGLLGDDMGMGKTYMALTFLGGLMRAKTIRNALIVAPLSVLRSWETEASKVVNQCVPNVRTVTVSSGMGKATRCRHLRTALEW